jgi:hypothetical protein
VKSIILLKRPDKTLVHACPSLAETHGLVASNPYVEALDDFFYAGGMRTERDPYVRDLLTNHQDKSYAASAVSDLFAIDHLDSHTFDALESQDNFTAETFRMNAMEAFSNNEPWNIAQPYSLPNVFSIGLNRILQACHASSRPNTTASQGPSMLSMYFYR